jgi:hypothetical protein
MSNTVWIDMSGIESYLSERENAVIQALDANTVQCLEADGSLQEIEFAKDALKNIPSKSPFIFILNTMHERLTGKLNELKHLRIVQDGALQAIQRMKKEFTECCRAHDDLVAQIDNIASFIDKNENGEKK